MGKNLLYIYGDPGTGKITTARILQRRLGWRLFWLHDLDQVCAIVGRYPLPRLMDKISLAVLEAMMDDMEDIIYVRPSRDLETVSRVLDLADQKGYSVYTVRLWADYETMVERIASRERSEFRISSKPELARYFQERLNTSHNLPELKGTFSTVDMPAEEVADIIQQLLFHERATNGQPDNFVCA